jgi:hypothetical protein
MVRWLYLATLVALQATLVAVVAPVLAEAVRTGLPGLEDPVDIARAAAGTVAIAATALTLAFPGFALARHHRRGRARFAGLPRWAIAKALAGGGVFVAALALAGIAALPGAGDAPGFADLAAAARNAGIALMAAGTLCAEVLRRPAGIPDAADASRAMSPPRHEVVAPADLATRAG